MSSTAVSWALYNAPKIDPTARLVLVYLAEHADKDGRGTWPAASTIAADLDISLPTVRRHLKALEAAKLIVRGDQRIVSHISADRRPVVWDLDMTVCKAPEDRAKPTKKPSRTASRPVAGDTPQDVDGVSPTTPRAVSPVIPRDLSPTTPRGVSPVNERGITGAHDGVSPVIPKPSTEPSAEPARPRTRPTTTSAGGPPAVYAHLTNKLVDQYVSRCRGPVSRRFKAGLFEQVDAAFGDGFSELQIVAGLRLLLDHPKPGPGLMPSLLQQAVNGAPALRPAPSKRNPVG